MRPAAGLAPDWGEGYIESILTEWTHASDPARVPIPHMDFLQNIHVLPRGVSFVYFISLSPGIPHSNATGSTSTATCTSFGSLIAPKHSLIALVRARMGLPRATT